ncbi:MAG: glycosyltransferase family 39 protein [Tepidisphaeraceae bacterium]
MWCALYLCCLLIVGCGAAKCLVRSRSWIEWAGWVLCLGPGVTGLCLVALSILGWRPSRLAILLLAAFFAVVAVVVRRTRSQESAPPAPPAAAPPPKWWTALCLIAIAYGIFVVALDTLVYPTIEWDAFAIWQLKSKVLASQPLWPRPAYFSNIALSFSHLRYPVLAPMISAGVHAMVGRIDDELEKAPFLLFYLGLGAAVYAAIQSRRGTTAALSATALLMTTPLMLNYAGSGTAEMALTAFYGCSIIFILRWQERQQISDLIAASLLSALMIWTKNEGYALAAINVLAILLLTPHPLRRRHLLAALACALLIAALSVPWIWYAHPLPRTDENYMDRLRVGLMLANLRRLPLILGSLLTEAIRPDHWCIFWFLLPAAAILNRRRPTQRPVVTLWILLAAQLLAYVPPFLVVDLWKNVKELLDVTTGRLLLHATPTAALLIGLQWPQLPRPAADRPAPMVH